jgi:hypothetical protein
VSFALRRWFNQKQLLRYHLQVHWWFKVTNKDKFKIVGRDFTFGRISKAEVPHDRKGKHHVIVSDIVRDLVRLKPGEALQVPRSAFGEQSLERVRAALNRATKKTGLLVGTSSDDDNLYVWVQDKES